MFERTSNMKNVSQSEYQYVSFKTLTEPENNWIHAFNSKMGQKKFKHYEVDLFSEKLNTVIQFHGCVFHAHEPCSSRCNRNRTPTTKNFTGRTFAEQKEFDEKFLDFMAQHFPSVKVQSIYGCEWKKLKSEKQDNGKSMWTNFKEKYATEYWDKRPLKRLIPREAIRGGAVQLYNFHFDKKDNDNFNLYFCDINNLYSDVAISTQFGFGQLEILIDPEEIKKHVYFNITDDQYYYKNIELQGGAAFCKVLVPCNDEYPFLPYRIKNEYTVMACCRTCAEKKLTRFCQHKKDSRLFTGCWMVSTLNQLRSEGGYSIEFLEIHYFSQKDYLLKDYVQILASERLKNSAVVNDSMTLPEKQIICDEINSAMQLPENLKLSPLECVNNPQQKQFYKLFMNSLFGMYSRNSSNIHTKNCMSQDDIDELAKTYTIEHVNLLSPNLCSVDYVLNSNTMAPNLDCNIFIGGEIASQAFVKLRKHLKLIIENQGIPLMIDTDSILFKMPKHLSNPLKMSPAIGHWKHEYLPGSIQKFYALASRNYAVAYSDEKNNLQQVLKVRGLSLKSALTQNVLNCDTFHSFLTNNQQQSICVSQCKRLTDKQTYKFSYRVSTYNFSNKLTGVRFLLTNDVKRKDRQKIVKTDSDLYKTFAFGYKLI